MIASTPSARCGSSPLARGRRVARQHTTRSERLIPAGAGATRRPKPRRSPGSAHPRWRGGDEAWTDYEGSCDGSSPLARGRHQMGATSRRKIRLIPAGAGATPHPRSCGCVPTAHPRWRGGDATDDGNFDAPLGSSPLARGRHDVESCLEVGIRLIPAGAGATGVSAIPGG